MRRWKRSALAGTLLVCVLVGAVGYLLASGPSHARRERVRSAPCTAATWREVLSAPRAITVTTLDTGIVRYRVQALIDPAQSARYRDDGTDMRVFAHLVRHASRGDVLIDSGLDAAYGRPGLGHIEAPASWYGLLHGLAFVQAPGADVHAQLERAGAHLIALYLTHLHVDHAAALPTFPLALPVYVGAGEPDDLAHHLDSGLVGERALRELELEHAPALAPFDHALDLYGDGSLWALATPGHTSGHLSFLVNGEREQVLLTGDVFHTRWAHEHGVAPIAATSEEQRRARRSAEQVRRFIRDCPQLRVVLGHQRLGE
jgi:N-acyl homoserine lactone hydrolase